ncbi:MAG: fumarylacetoacetate hydrolase family protein, partial [Planctomycetota bacterium]|nr:fumarylacetoacetate hydrolase family protein [Planctomycetota bacterium]
PPSTLIAWPVMPRLLSCDSNTATAATSSGAIKRRWGLIFSEADALSYVGAYAIGNDVSARWWQKEGSGGQWVRGKSFDTFCPLSEPVDAGRTADPQALHLVAKLNGEIVQEADTADMIFPVAALIAELSRGTTLLAGTVILTGTPSGVGAARNPPRFLRPGDMVEITIDPLGTLRNPVERESGQSEDAS